MNELLAMSYLKSFADRMWHRSIETGSELAKAFYAAAETIMQSGGNQRAVELLEQAKRQGLWREPRE